MAWDWLDRMHNEPGFNDSWARNWAVLPPPDEMFTPEVRPPGLATQPGGMACCCQTPPAPH
jgi:hypothetical protein